MDSYSSEKEIGQGKAIFILLGFIIMLIVFVILGFLGALRHEGVTEGIRTHLLEELGVVRGIGQG